MTFNIRHPPMRRAGANGDLAQVAFGSAFFLLGDEVALAVTYCVGTGHQLRTGHW